jgi:hypothetical protein
LLSCLKNAIQGQQARAVCDAVDIRAERDGGRLDEPLNVTAWPLIEGIAGEPRERESPGRRASIHVDGYSVLRPILSIQRRNRRSHGIFFDFQRSE